ncbi:MAG: HIT family protein [Bacteriovoracaceae bacterium]|nr:HIT family protein [Bacteriovoracaceae bacterium]
MSNKESKENCIFCKILSGEFECSEIYSDDTVIAFLDIQPVNPGHVLVIPREHACYLKDLDKDVGGKLFQVGQKVAEAIRNSDLKCEGVNFLLADGEAAGQEVWHTHLHVVPRFENDGFGFKFSEKYFEKPSREELNQVAEKISKKI